MAGIGFELKKLSQRDDLLGLFEAYSHSSVAASGPWVFTILALGGISLWGTSESSVDTVALFRLIVIYNFAFSLVLSSPVIIVATRFLADRVFEADVQDAPGMLVGGMLVLFLALALFAVPFYFFHVSLAPLARIGALINFFLVTAIWISSVFLTALKDYRAVSRSFASGMAVALIGCLWAADLFGTVSSLLLAFNAGLTVILFYLISRVLEEYPYPVQRPFRMVGHFREYWSLAAGGLAYSTAIWIDKWILWFSPQGETLASGLISFPDYDSASFLAYLTIVPSMALFVLNIETRFFEKYLRFYRSIARHATFAEIRTNHQEILRELMESSRNVIMAQAAISFSVIMLAPKLFRWFDVSFLQLGMFRLAVLGALFHVLFLFMSILLSYFDMRMAALKVNLLFLVSNTVFTLITVDLGFAYYGYGYFLAAVLTAAVTFGVLAHHTRDLLYQTFVLNNQALR